MANPATDNQHTHKPCQHEPMMDCGVPVAPLPVGSLFCTTEPTTQWWITRVCRHCQCLYIEKER